ncbi:hypothetical protein [Streptomyces sp. NPDC052012]|uniref:hypothetical protein n=1 Tax=Streptomyces sp. NPDC052012 TaxID=3155051 RepID=UPI00344B7A4A
MRIAVLASDCADHALRYGPHALHDVTAHEHALRPLAPSDAVRAIAAARLHRALLD